MHIVPISRKSYIGEDILSEITDEMENDDKEDDDDDPDPSPSLLTSQEPLQSVQSLRAFFFKPFIYK
ncbi:hypothetical protein AVEN_206433-1 [Araneus ventricosus]|uniref:Uncharacterized protein n=1 Tax=Araneus ventricosus TaxID=182803 RepID=A0A4Y2NSK4_ARAVE|nr:hypothetical protein AVEN_206433-1 [Araneus ventricosus]